MSSLALVAPTVLSFFHILFLRSDNILHSFFYQNHNKKFVLQFTSSPKRLSVVPEWTRTTDERELDKVTCQHTVFSDPVTSAVCHQAPIWDARINHFTFEAPKFSPLIARTFNRKWRPGWRQETGAIGGRKQLVRLGRSQRGNAQLEAGLMVVNHHLVSAINSSVTFTPGLQPNN